MSCSLAGVAGRLQAPRAPQQALSSTRVVRRGPQTRQRSLVVFAARRIPAKYGKYGLGQKLEPEWLSPGRSLGSGSFGECYKGTLRTEDGEELEVVLKRVKSKVQGAEEMHEAEHMINVLATKAAGEAVAPFIGYTMVEAPSGRLSKGLWLVWEYEGDKTLAYYLKRRDMERALAEDLGVEEAAAVPTVMKQIFKCLVTLHSAGIVHRDIKPANIVFDERRRRFRLIDLGAAACLRTGTNYKPGETILDPCYCPPEEYVLPTDAPHLGQQGTRLRTVMTPVLWTQHRPDCFDTYSAGVVLMQLGLPFLRTTSSLRTFNGALARCKYDLDEWRVRSGLPARQTAILDANSGAGWDLAAALLRPREVINDETGGVKFLNSGRAPRLSASAALKHPFVKQAAGGAAAPAPAAEQQGTDTRNRGGSASRSVGTGSRSGTGNRGGTGSRTSGTAGRSVPANTGGGSGSAGLLGMWGALRNRMFDMEARVMQEATATELQTGVVQQLRSDVAAGRVSPDALKREEAALEDMQKNLNTSVFEMNNVFGAARGFLAGVLGGGGSDRRRVPQQLEEGEEREAASGRSSGSASRSVSRSTSRSVSRSVSRTVSRPEEFEPSSVEAAEAAGAAAGAAVTNAAAGILRFTGSAFTSLATFAVTVTEQMERNAQQAAEEAAAQKKAAAAYLNALQALTPPLSGSSSWEEGRQLVPEEPEFLQLSVARREQVFNAYIDVLAKAEAASRAKALAAFQRLMLSAQVGAETEWEEFEDEYGDDERFNMLAEGERRAAFDAFVGQLQAARAGVERRDAGAAEEAARAAAAADKLQEEVKAAKARGRARLGLQLSQVDAGEAAFRQLLQEQEALVASGAPYVQIKRMLWADPRFDAVPEYRRKKLYAEYVTVLQEAGVMAAALDAAAPAPLPAPTASTDLPDAEKGSGTESLDFLRREQARLKEEYSKMEAKLRSMEARLQPGAAEQAEGSGATVVTGETVTYNFDGDQPSAAELGQAVAVNGSTPNNN